MHDVVVVGGGPGGYAVAFRAAARGLDVALVERDKIGGTCLHRGCIPSKAILHVAGVIEEVQRGEVLGLHVTYDGLDGAGLDDFRSGVIRGLHRGLKGLASARCTVHEGHGRVLEPGVVEVSAGDGEATRVEGRHVVLATGSTPRSLPNVEIDGEVVQTSDQALWFTEPPQRAVVVGAGAIGMEFASMWRPMGTEVTVVEALDRVLPLEDADASKAVEKAFRRSGIETLTSAQVKDVRVDDGAAQVEVETADGGRTLDADVVLIAVGRGPNTADTGAGELGVLDDRGFVRADAFGRTDVDGVWGVGDVLPTLALAHAAFAEGFRIADLIAGEPHVVPVDYAQVPRVTYCRPEVASVGLTEEQAVESHGRDGVASSTVSLRGNAKGIIHGSDGFVKVVTSTGDGRTLGVHIVGPEATDLIGEATLATEWGALASEVGAISHAHPTLYEAMGEAFMSAAGVPFHAH